MTEVRPPPRPPSLWTRFWLIAAPLILLSGIASFYVGAHSQQDDIDDRDHQLATCGDVADTLLAELQNAFAALKAGDDVGDLQAASEQQQRLSADMRRQYGTDDVPTIIDKCKEGG